MNWRFGCLAMFVLIIGAPVVASRYLPWWGTLLFIGGEGALLLWGLPKLIAFGAKRFAMGLFATKSRVLHGAACRIHSVSLTAAPVTRRPVLESPQDDADSGDEHEDEDLLDDDAEIEVNPPPRSVPGARYVLIDFTITPKPGQSRMTHYEPSELLLIPFDRKIRMDEDSADSAESATLKEIRFVDENGEETEDFDKLTGPARFRAIFACPPTFTGRAKFQYYFESFGDVMLP